MTPEFATTLVNKTLLTAAMIAGPILNAGLVVGLLVAIFQAITTIHEMTLVFIPKLIAVGLVLMFLFPWIIMKLMDFTYQIYQNVKMLGG